MLNFSTSTSPNANLIIHGLEVHSIEGNPIYIIKQAIDSRQKIVVLYGYFV
jgi:hypothetical protein